MSHAPLIIVAILCFVLGFAANVEVNNLNNAKADQKLLKACQEQYNVYYCNKVYRYEPDLKQMEAKNGN